MNGPAADSFSGKGADRTFDRQLLKSTNLQAGGDHLHHED